MLVKLSQSRNAYVPILVMLSGIIMFAQVKALQPSNMPSLMLVRLSESVMLIRLSQYLNTLLPMLVTLSGIVMLIRLVQ